MYAPYFSYLGRQTSPNLHLNKDTWDSNRPQYALTTLIDTVLQHMDDLDKYNSLDNGVCIQIHERPWKCFYLDRIFLGKFLHDIVVYPGQSALSISSMDDNLYYASSSPYEIEKTFWSSTLVSTNLTKYLQLEFYFLDKLSYIFLNNRAQSLVHIIGV